MSAPLLKTKLFVPPVRPELVSRLRLVEQLNAGLHSARKLSLISAAAGFGKTTLVVEWLYRAERPFTWLSLDAGDNDPVRFLTYLIVALQKIDNEIGQTTRSLLASPQVPAAELAMTTLINGIAGTDARFVLVLDDYHEVRAEWIHKAVEFLIAHQPPQLHLVILTRADPPLPMSRLRVRGQVTEIWTDDLRFTEEECAAFLSQTLGRALDAKAVTALGARTEGWIAGLQLASLALQAPLSPRDEANERVTEFIAAFSGSHRHVIDYLTDEVLALQPGDIQSFLRQTAILNRLTAPLCDAVTERDDSDKVLRQLDKANLFLISLDDQRKWYRYHSLFADFLRTELDQASLRALHLKAARWFATQGLLPEAVRHALDSGNTTQAAQMIALAAEEAFQNAEFATLSGWLDALPSETVRSNSQLGIYKGFLLVLTDKRHEVSTYAQAAERSLTEDAPPAIRGRLQSLNALVAQCNGDTDSSILLARAALGHLEASDAFFHDLTQNTLGQSLEMQGDLAAAADVYRDALLVRRKTGNQLGTLVLLTNLAFALNELGQRRDALALCQQFAEEKGNQTDRVIALTDGAYVAWSLLSLEANELSLAHDQALRALAICQRGNVIDGVLWAQFVLARVELAIGEIEAFHQTCLKGRQLAEEASRLHKTWFAALEAQASLGQGDLAAATRWAESANINPANIPQRWDEFVYFTYVRLLLAQQRSDEAGNLLAAMKRSAEQSGRGRSLITIFLLQARIRLALGQQGQALSRLDDALRLAAPQDYRRAFLDEGPAVIDLLPQVRQTAPGFVESLEQAFLGESAVRREDDGHPSPLLEPLTSREQEILRLIAAGLSNPEIAELLYLSLNTVKWHAKNLYAKLSVSNRVEAIIRAQELDLL